MSKIVIPVIQKHTRFVVHVAHKGIAHVRHRKRHYFIGGGIVLGLILAVQLLYPGNRALPLAQVNGQGVGLKSQSDITSQLQATYNGADLQIKFAQKTVDSDLHNAGIVVDYDKTKQNATSYPWWQRLIPFSFVYKMIAHDYALVTTHDPQLAAELLENVQKMCAVAPKNAAVKVEGEQLGLEPAANGAECKKDDIAKTIASYSPRPQDNQLTITPTVLKPQRSDEQVRAKLDEAAVILNRKVVLQVGNNITEVPKAEKAKWLAFPEDEKTQHISVSLSDEAIAAYLATAQKDIYIAPGTTAITLVDGVETGRSVGAPGRGIDTPKTTTAIKEVLLASSSNTTVVATLATLPPKEQFRRNYTNTPRGLQVLLDDIAKEKGNYGISVIELTGQRRSLNVNGGTSFEAASTYKLFVAYSVLKRIESGAMKWDDSVVGGRSASQCFDDMIVKSDNPCAEEWGKKIGWNTIQSEIRALGLASTKLGTTFYSTANDQALFLAKLERGEFLNNDSRQRLLGVMKRQQYRAGIAAGVGVDVADKVGFLNGLLHDSAIVYSPKGTYVLVIMTSGSSWGNIADTAKRINNLLNS